MLGRPYSFSIARKMASSNYAEGEPKQRSSLKTDVQEEVKLSAPLRYSCVADWVRPRRLVGFHCVKSP